MTDEASGSDDTRDRALVEAVLAADAKRLRGRAARVQRIKRMALVRVTLQTRFERRTLGSRRAPDVGKPKHVHDAPAMPDVWAITAAVPTDGAESKHEIALEREARTIACSQCDANGTDECPRCRGRGSVLDEPPIVALAGVALGIAAPRHSHGVHGVAQHALAHDAACPGCHGSGRVQCSACHGTRHVRDTPVVIIETGTLRAIDNIDDGSLPTKLLLQLSDARCDGRELFREEGHALAPRASAPGLGYRDFAPRVSPAIDAHIDALLARPHSAGGDSRSRGVVLTVQEIPVMEVELSGSRVTYMAGDPLALLDASATTGARSDSPGGGWVTIASMAVLLATAAMVAWVLIR